MAWAPRHPLTLHLVLRELELLKVSYSVARSHNMLHSCKRTRPIDSRSPVVVPYGTSTSHTYCIPYSQFYIRTDKTNLLLFFGRHIFTAKN